MQHKTRWDGARLADVRLVLHNPKNHESALLRPELAVQNRLERSPIFGWRKCPAFLNRHLTAFEATLGAGSFSHVWSAPFGDMGFADR